MSPVALDATLFDEPTTGIALYAHELFRALSLAGVAVERWGAARTGERPRGRTGRSQWTLFDLPGLLASHRPRLFHALANFNLPLARTPGVPTVLTVHDLVPVLLPDTVSTPFRWQFHGWLTRSLAVADHVITVSDVTRRALLERYDVAPQKVTTVLHGVDHVERLAQPDAITVKWLDALGLPERWVLYAGSLDARKNVALLLDACARLHDGGAPVTLVLAGQTWFGAGAVEGQVRALKERGLDVRALGYLDASVFYALMRRAPVFVFPSRYEGFGLPPLEAMALGVPTIVSTGGSLPEVCGDGAVQVAPDDAVALAGELDRLLGDKAAARALGARGLAWSQRFRWATCAQETAAVYDAV